MDRAAWRHPYRAFDKSGANPAELEAYNTRHYAGIEICQAGYLNDIVEQDHRAIKRMTRPMPGFKAFRSAATTVAGVEIMHVIGKANRALGKAKAGAAGPRPRRIVQSIVPGPPCPLWRQIPGQAAVRDHAAVTACAARMALDTSSITIFATAEESCDRYLSIA